MKLVNQSAAARSVGRYPRTIRLWIQQGKLKRRRYKRVALEDVRKLVQAGRKATSHSRIAGYGLSDRAVLERVAALQPKYTLLTSMFTFEQVLVDRLVRAIKGTLPRVTVILGGIHASVRPEWHFEESNPDFIVIGEGEKTIVELLRELEKPEP